MHTAVKHLQVQHASALMMEIKRFSSTLNDELVNAIIILAEIFLGATGNCAEHY